MVAKGAVQTGGFTKFTINPLISVQASGSSSGLRDGSAVAGRLGETDRCGNLVSSGVSNGGQIRMRKILICFGLFWPI